MKAQTPQPPLKSYLIPDSLTGDQPSPPAGDAAASPGKVQRTVSPINAHGKPPAPRLKNRLRRSRTAKFTLAQAFDYFWQPDDSDLGDINFERAIRAIGFLLHWSSDMGNEPMDGNAANGLGYIADFTANQIVYLQGAQDRKLEELQDELRHVKERT